MKKTAVREESNTDDVKFLDFFPEEEREKICRKIRKDKIPKKTIIHFQEDEECRFYEIIVGQVKISKFTSDGREVTVDILKEGDLFGFVSLVDGGRCECTATALTPVEVNYLSPADFQDLINNYSEFANLLLNSSCDRLRRIYGHMETLSSGNVQARVSRIILEMARQEGDYDDNDILSFKIRLTHQELANLAGTTRETVTRVLAFLKKNSYINVKRSMVTILREDDMEEIS